MEYLKQSLIMGKDRNNETRTSHYKPTITTLPIKSSGIKQIDNIFTEGRRQSANKSKKNFAY